MRNAEIAAKYAEYLGWNVFPVADDCRQPLTKHGYKDASSDPEDIARMWRCREDSNIALAAGSLSGVMILDVDNKNSQPGHASLKSMMQQFEPLPLSWRADTPSGGSHLFFRQPDRAIKNRVGFLPGLDIRTTGGSVALAPSTRAGCPYLWRRDPMDGCELCDAPCWLLDIIDPPQPAHTPIPLRAHSADRLTRYVMKALDGEIGNVTNQPANTGRNQQLFLSSCQLGSLMAAGVIDRDLIVSNLEAAAHLNGLVRDDGLRSVRATIESGLRTGAKNPREIAVGR